jgi:uncharacterized protein YgiM (DUF1202 family)
MPMAILNLEVLMDHVNYNNMFGNDEVVEELPQAEVEFDNQLTEIVETVEEVFVEDISEPQDHYVKVDLDPVGKLRLRSAPSMDGEILGTFVTGTVFLVLDDSNPEWYEVVTGDGDGGVSGYVKKAFVTDAPEPTSF